MKLRPIPSPGRRSRLSTIRFVCACVRANVPACITLVLLQAKVEELKNAEFTMEEIKEESDEWLLIVNQVKALINGHNDDYVKNRIEKGETKQPR